MNTKTAAAVTLLFYFVIGLSVVTTDLSLAIPGWYLLLGATTFAVYAIDKSAATRGRWRTSERSLHVLALAGGWPGALLGQQVFRHKTRKMSFLIVFGLTVLFNCAGLFWLHTADGRTRLDQLLTAIANVLAH